MFINLLKNFPPVCLFGTDFYIFGTLEYPNGQMGLSLRSNYRKKYFLAGTIAGLVVGLIYFLYTWWKTGASSGEL